MDLTRQLRYGLFIRALFVAIQLSGVLWIHADDHGLTAVDIVAGVGGALLVTVPFFLLCGRVETRRLATAAVITDLAVVTAAMVFGSGTSGAQAIFYVWPIIVAAIFLRSGRRMPSRPAAAPPTWASVRYSTRTC